VRHLNIFILLTVTIRSTIQNELLLFHCNNGYANVLHCWRVVFMVYLTARGMVWWLVNGEVERKCYERTVAYFELQLCLGTVRDFDKPQYSRCLGCDANLDFLKKYQDSYSVACHCIIYCAVYLIKPTITLYFGVAPNCVQVTLLHVSACFGPLSRSIITVRNDMYVIMSVVHLHLHCIFLRNYVLYL
jgi:hypothetical protein